MISGLSTVTTDSPQRLRFLKLFRIGRSLSIQQDEGFQK
jgi:hypothetical protein